MSSRPRYNLLKLSEARNWHPEIKNLITVIQKYGNPYSKIVIAINQNVWLLISKTQESLTQKYRNPIFKSLTVLNKKGDPKRKKLGSFTQKSDVLGLISCQLITWHEITAWTNQSTIKNGSSQTFWFMAITIFE